MNSMNRSDNPGIYIHIPFCRSKCKYCNFFSITSRDDLDGFMRTLIKEIGMYTRHDQMFDSLYIGGGTPSLLHPGHVETLVDSVCKNFALSRESEITLEANPQDLDLSFLTSIRHVGINRLNIGIQSFNADVLSFLGRRHTVKEAITAVENARRADFDNVGLDLIFGVPNQTRQLWLDTLEQALAFMPEHLSCYELTLEPDTPLGRDYQQGNFSLPDENRQCDLFFQTAGTLDDAGYIHYEISNFARDMTFASRHNQKYWYHVPYLGFGPAAHSFGSDKRWWNYSSLSRYTNNIEQGMPPVEETEYLSEDQLRLEALYLGLRTMSGINLAEFAAKYSYDILSEKKQIIGRLIDEGFVEIANGCLYPTKHGMAVADSLSMI